LRPQQIKLRCRPRIQQAADIVQRLPARCQILFTCGQTGLRKTQIDIGHAKFGQQDSARVLCGKACCLQALGGPCRAPALFTEKPDLCRDTKVGLVAACIISRADRQIPIAGQPVAVTPCNRRRFAQAGLRLGQTKIARKGGIYQMDQKRVVEMLPPLQVHSPGLRHRCQPRIAVWKRYFRGRKGWPDCTARQGQNGPNHWDNAHFHALSASGVPSA
jgi:hypothetical protein